MYVQYTTTMKKVFTGDLISYYNGLNVGEEIRKGFPRTLALAVGAALLWMAVAVVFGSGAPCGPGNSPTASSRSSP